MSTCWHNCPFFSVVLVFTDCPTRHSCVTYTGSYCDRSFTVCLYSKSNMTPWPRRLSHVVQRPFACSSLFNFNSVYISSWLAKMAALIIGKQDD